MTVMTMKDDVGETKGNKLTTRLCGVAAGKDPCCWLRCGESAAAAGEALSVR